MSTTEKDMGKRAIMRMVRELDGASVEVGVFEPEHAAKAVHHEFGTSTIPARPFLRASQGEVKAGQEIGRATSLARVGGASALAVLERVGQQGEDAARRHALELDAPALAPSTVAAKGSSKPLVDTGGMVAAITHKVHP